MIETTSGRAGRDAKRLTALRRSDGERGAALIEAAILMPLVIMLIFGLIAFGRAYNAKVTATHAAREGVRVLAVSGDNMMGENAALAAAAGLDAANLTVSSTVCDPGDPTSVTVNYVFSYQIPVFGDRTVNISETGVMRCGG